MQSYVRKRSVNLLTTSFQILKLKRRHSGWKLSQQLKGKMIFAAARLIYGQCHSDRISNALIISSEPGANGGWRWPCSCTMPLMELRCHTWVNWFVSPICLVDVPSALLGPIVCWYRPSNCLPSAAWPVARPTICNSLPDNVVSAPSLSTFRLRLKHFCFGPRSLT